jgi:hypothetical protein
VVRHHAVVVIVALAGCFKPSLTDHLQCAAPDDWCPPPQTCINHVCEGPVSDGGGSGDGGGGDGGLPEANLVFTSSLTFHPGKRSNAAILQAADDQCNMLGQKLRAGTYMAWLGVDATDAANRIDAKTMGAPGWARSDGRPFTTSLDDLKMGHVYYPLRLDDNRADVVAVNLQTAVVTELPGAGCDAAGIQTVRIGLAPGNEPAWRSFDTRNCDVDLWLYCFEVDRSIAVAPPVLDPGLAIGFETGLEHAIDAGLAALDSACQSEADAANLSPRTFLALVATSTGTARSRFSTATRPWTRLDGVVFAPASLGKFDAPLSIVPGSPPAHFPSTVAVGAPDLLTQALNNNCNDWKPSTLAATSGFSGMSDGLAFNLGGTDCSTTARLYCLEAQ